MARATRVFTLEKPGPSPAERTAAMKKAITALMLGAMLLGGSALAGCASSKCCDGNPPCGKCAEMKEKGCPDCKAAGGMCDHCKAMMK